MAVSASAAATAVRSGVPGTAVRVQVRPSAVTSTTPFRPTIHATVAETAVPATMETPAPASYWVAQVWPESAECSIVEPPVSRQRVRPDGGATITCAEKNDNVIDRNCILTEAAAIEDWTAGGMHSPTNPGVEEPPECGMFVTVEDGKWTRLYPELGGEDDDDDGFHCPADSIVKVPDDMVPGEGAVDPDREI